MQPNAPYPTENSIIKRSCEQQSRQTNTDIRLVPYIS